MANCYIINYDLRKSRDYESLYEAIRSYRTYAKILESCWAVVSERSAAEIRDHLLSVMDSDDGIFVVKSGREAAWNRVDCEGQWLKDNL
jgi:hypothetical protein